MRNQEIKMQKEKKTYQKPEMEVVAIGLQGSLLEVIPVVMTST